LVIGENHKRQHGGIFDLHGQRQHTRVISVRISSQADELIRKPGGNLGMGNGTLHEGAALTSHGSTELDQDPLTRGARPGQGLIKICSPVQRALVVKVRVRMKVRHASIVASKGPQGATLPQQLLPSSQNRPLLVALAQIALDERMDIPVQNPHHIAIFVACPVILDHLIGIEHIGADLIAPGNFALFAIDRGHF